MQIRSFGQAQAATLRWLHDDGGESRHFWRRPDPAGWRLDESGFYVARAGRGLPSSWSVRYWHLNRKDLSGAVSVFEDGRVEPGAGILHGCLGLFPEEILRIDPDGTTPVETGYPDPGSAFVGGHDSRIEEWYRQGWVFEAVS